MNAAASADILDLPLRFLVAVWDMLSQLSSCSTMIHVPSYRKLARTVFQYYVEDLGPWKSMTANLHMLVAHVADWVQYIQENYDIPPGRCTEGSLEAGHAVVKKCLQRFSRKCSFKLANYDVMVRGFWTSDLLLHYEKNIGQRIRVGAARSGSKARVGSDEIGAPADFDALEDDVFVGALADLDMWHNGEVDMYEAPTWLGEVEDSDALEV